MIDLNTEISNLIDKVEKKYEPEAELPGRQELLGDLHGLKRGLPWLLPTKTGESNRNEILKLQQMIENKLAMKSEAVRKGDYWWEATSNPEIESLLWEIKTTLNKALKRTLWRRVVPHIWTVIKQLLYLGIVIALVLSNRSPFETRVIAVLVLVYNLVGNYVATDFLAASIRSVALASDLGRLGRALNTMWEAPQITDEIERDKMNLLIRMSGFSIGNAIAIVSLLLSFR